MGTKDRTIAGTSIWLDLDNGLGGYGLEAGLTIQRLETVSCHEHRNLSTSLFHNRYNIPHTHNSAPAECGHGGRGAQLSVRRRRALGASSPTRAGLLPPKCASPDRYAYMLYNLFDFCLVRAIATDSVAHRFPTVDIRPRSGVRILR